MAVKKSPSSNKNERTFPPFTRPNGEGVSLRYKGGYKNPFGTDQEKGKGKNRSAFSVRGQVRFISSPRDAHTSPTGSYSSRSRYESRSAQTYTHQSRTHTHTHTKNTHLIQNEGESSRRHLRPTGAIRSTASASTLTQPRCTDAWRMTPDAAPALLTHFLRLEQAFLRSPLAIVESILN